MDRRKFLSWFGIGATAVVVTPLVAEPYLKGIRSSVGAKPYVDQIKNWRSYPKHHTTTLYAGAENEKWIEDSVRRIRTQLASINVQSSELDVMCDAYRRSIRQRIGNEERPLSELVRATREYYEKWGVRAKATWQPDGTIIVEPA